LPPPHPFIRTTFPPFGPTARNPTRELELDQGGRRLFQVRHALLRSTDVSYQRTLNDGLTLDRRCPLARGSVHCYRSISRGTLLVGNQVRAVTSVAQVLDLVGEEPRQCVPQSAKFRTRERSLAAPSGSAPHRPVCFKHTEESLEALADRLRVLLAEVRAKKARHANMLTRLDAEEERLAILFARIFPDAAFALTRRGRRSRGPSG
jgi:hypothetical protein